METKEEEKVFKKEEDYFSLDWYSQMKVYITFTYRKYN
jgi:hypothetical protein